MRCSTDSVKNWRSRDIGSLRKITSNIRDNVGIRERAQNLMYFLTNKSRHTNTLPDSCTRTCAYATAHTHTHAHTHTCILKISDAANDTQCVNHGDRRNIKKKKQKSIIFVFYIYRFVHANSYFFPMLIVH